MSVFYTIGYGNMSIERIAAAMEVYSKTVLVDVRRYPFSQNRPEFNRKDLSSRLKERYISDHYLGNGAKGGEHDSRWHVDGIWYANVLDWPFTPPDEKSLQEALIQHMRRLRTFIDGYSMVPMFFCSEFNHLECHRSNVADFARQHVWQGFEIVHLEGEIDAAKIKQGA